MEYYSDINGLSDAVRGEVTRFQESERYENNYKHSQMCAAKCQ